MNHLANSGVIRHEPLTLILKCDQTTWLHPEDSITASKAQGSSAVFPVEPARVTQGAPLGIVAVLWRSGVRVSPFPAQQLTLGGIPVTFPGINSAIATLGTGSFVTPWQLMH